MIVRVNSPVLYTIQGQKYKSVIHHNRLRLCEDRRVPLWLRKLRTQVLDLDETVLDEGFDDDEYAASPDMDLNILFDVHGSDVVSSSLTPAVEDALTPVMDDEISDASDKKMEAVIGDADDQPIPPQSQVGLPVSHGVSRRGRHIRRPARYNDYTMGDLD